MQFQNSRVVEITQTKLTLELSLTLGEMDFLVLYCCEYLAFIEIPTFYTIKWTEFTFVDFDLVIRNLFLTPGVKYTTNFQLCQLISYPFMTILNLERTGTNGTTLFCHSITFVIFDARITERCVTLYAIYWIYKKS